MYGIVGHAALYRGSMGIVPDLQGPIARQIQDSVRHHSDLKNLSTRNGVAGRAARRPRCELVRHLQLTARRRPTISIPDQPPT
jgi:hypothetical protein